MLQIKGRSKGSITFKVASEIATNLCTPLFSQIYAQINPEILGEDERDLKIAHEYGKRLATYGKNISDKMIEKLVNDYPTHDFVIDMEESNELFTRVELPSAELTTLTFALGERAFRTSREEIDIDFIKLGAIKEEAKSEAEPAKKAEKAEGTGANDDAKANKAA